MNIFAETEQTEVWIKHLHSLTPPDRAVVLPDGDALIDALRALDIPDEDIPDIVALAPVLTASPELWWYVERTVWAFVERMGAIDGPPRIAALRDINDPQYRYFYVLVYVAALPAIREYHRHLGIPDDISRATLADVGRNVRVHRKREGIGGLGVAWWLMLHFTGVIYQLGRLQFERSRLDTDIAEKISESGPLVTAETPALSIHIPDFCGPMSVELCDASIDQARAFFPTYFPDTPYDYAICRSWLLDPRLKESLRPESNIIRYQERFDLTGPDWDSNEGIMQFVFGKKPEDVDCITPASSLERAVVEHIRAGGTWHGYGGWFRLDGPTQE